MFEVKKRNIGFFIIVITILLLVVIIAGGLFLLDKVDYKEPKVEEKKENDICDVSLFYYIDKNSILEKEIKLTEEDKRSFNDVLEGMEYSEANSGMNNIKYRINSCDIDLIIGNDKTITKGNENVEITKGYEDLISLLEVQENKLNRVFLFEIDIANYGNSEMYKEIEMLDEDKNRIRDLWNNQDKNIEYIDLAIELGKMLIIDDDSFDISLNTAYVEYKDGYVLLDKEIHNILKKYLNVDNDTSSNLEYTINNDMDVFNSRFSEKGVYYDTLNTPDASHYYTIASGTKSSSGYSISIDKVNIDQEGNVEILVKEESLKSGEIAMTVLTYPTCQIEFKKLPKSIVVKDENGKEFKHLNF